LPLLFLAEHNPLGFQFLTEELHEFFVFKIELKTVLGVFDSHLIGVLSTPVAGLLAVHKTNCRQDEGPDVPSRSPCLLVVVGK
jgi:hypothetical protein